MASGIGYRYRRHPLSAVPRLLTDPGPSRRTVALGLTAWVAACARETGTQAGLPEPPIAFKEASVSIRSGSGVPPPDGWWKIFADPGLDDLVPRANRSNWTIKLAAARLAQARAAAHSSFALRMPRIGANLNASRQDGPLTNAAGTSGPLLVAAVNLSYEVDLFGRLARESQATRIDVAERQDLLRAAALLVQADTAETWFNLRALDAERAVVRGAAEAQAKSAALTRGMVNSGLAPELSLTRLLAESENIAAEALTLDRRRAELEHALSVLVGEPVSTFQIPTMDQTATPPVIPPGIPARVLARRPDVGAARQAMLAAMTRVDVARDSWLPNLTLTASGGFASPAVGTLLRAAAGATGVGALLAIPLFDGGQYRARVEGANATLDAAAATYAQNILEAIKDVEDQLSGLRLLAEQESVLKNANLAAQRTTALVASNYRNGLASQLELLDAQRTELRNRRQLLRTRAARFQASVGLIRALGGGWEATA